METPRAFYDRRPTTPKSPKRQRPKSPRRRRASSEPVALGNPYMLYYIDRFPVLKEQCDTVTAVAALVAQEWASMNESAKAEYRKQAEATQTARKSLCFFEKDDEVLKPSTEAPSVDTPKKVNASQKKKATRTEDVEVTKEEVTFPAKTETENAAPAPEIEANGDVVPVETTVGSPDEPPAEDVTSDTVQIKTKTPIVEAAENSADSPSH